MSVGQKMIVFLYRGLIKIKSLIDKPLRDRRKRRIAVAQKEKSTFISHINQINSRLEINPDNFLPSRVFVNGNYEPDLINYLKRILRPGMICVDIGANVGYLTILMAKRVGTQGHVLSFEPTQRSYNALCRNVRLNNLTNVAVHQLALTDHDGTLDFHEGPPDYDVYNTAGNISHPSAQRVVFKKSIVPCKTLDNYLSENKIQQVDLIKIDVEGGELLALKGMETTLEHNPHINLIVEFADQTTQGFGYQAKEIGFWLEERGWSLMIIEALGFAEPTKSDRAWKGEIVVASKQKK